MFAEQAAANALRDALFGYSIAATNAIRPSDRFAHYTSPVAAAKIIGGDTGGNRSLWLRNSRLMNDFTEVEWGHSCLKAALQDWRIADRLHRVLNAIHPEIAPALEKSLREREHELGQGAYLLSLAIHTGEECFTGKLSMWRAYGGIGNVCLIFNTVPFLNYQSAYELVMSPVMYGGPDEFRTEFEAVLYRLERVVPLVSSLHAGYVSNVLKRAFDYAVLSTKHKGFHEETEWRVIHQPSDNRPEPPSIADPSDITQTIYQMPLQNRPDDGIWGAELQEVLDRIIIGPLKTFAESDAVKAEYVKMLESAGVPNASDRVVFCGIPLRRD